MFDLGQAIRQARRVAVLCNWEFFRAPLAGIVSMHRDLGLVDALGVGMFLQTLRQRVANYRIESR